MVSVVWSAFQVLHGQSVVDAERFVVAESGVGAAAVVAGETSVSYTVIGEDALPVAPIYVYPDAPGGCGQVPRR